jgi:hypothetical protein
LNEETKDRGLYGGVKLKILGLLSFFCAALVLNGCSTGPFLKPYAAIGEYNTENPACPGAENVLEIGIPGYDWLIIRVLAKEPTKYRPEGTRLIAYVMPDLYKHSDSGGSWPLFPSEEERVRKERLVSERKSKSVEVSFSRTTAIITLSNGSQSTVELPFFQKPYKYPSVKYYGIWGPEAVIANEKLDDFTVELPSLLIDGVEFVIPTIEFKVTESKYAPVLNC